MISREVPKKTKGDIAHSVVKGVLSSIPYVGGGATELFTALVQPPIEKRRDEWISSIVDKLYELEARIEGFDILKLQGNPIFISTLLEASNISIRNHKKEKIEVLRNIVIKSIDPNVDEDLIAIFLNLADILTPWHIKLLGFFNNHREYFSQSQNIGFSNINQAISAAFTGLPSGGWFLDKIINDLESQNLVKAIPIGTMMTSQGVMDSRTTELGRNFLKYISANE